METTQTRIRVRFAPSPTGYLHVGGARTALYNYLFAKNTGGEFILRIEDTDLERSTEESMRMQIQDLKWLGLKWDEGPDPETLVDRGAFGPYRQSQRTGIYQEHADRLVAAGKAYYDFRTDAELDKIKEAHIAAGRSAQVSPPDQIVLPDEARRRINAGESAAIRFRVSEVKDYILQDLVRGEVRFPSDMVGDFVCIRSNGMPVYNFCCVIDDASMQITHVFRAEEHLSNTLRQLMLYEAFGYPPPLFGHLSFILGPDRQKLSKRHGATSCNDYRLKGYLPEALNNFILLSGWSSPKGQEIMTKEEMIEQFTFERFNAAPAVFDEAKLDWMNATYLRALSDDELWRRLEPFMSEAGIDLPMANDSEWRQMALAGFRSKMTNFVDGANLFVPLSDAKFAVRAEGLEVLKWPEVEKVLLAWQNELKSSPGEWFSEAEFDALQDRVKQVTGAKGKTLFQPIRVAVIGQPHGTELKQLVPLLRRSSLLKRVQICLDKCAESSRRLV